MVSMTDTGRGMARDVVASTFDLISTTKLAGQGTSLEFPMVYGFIK